MDGSARHLIATLAQDGSGSFRTDDSPASLIERFGGARLDLLNDPERLSGILNDLNIVWATIFVIVGAMCILHGYRWHKTLIILLAAMSGIWVGTALGQNIGSREIAAACFAVLLGVLAWPLMKFAVALFGGVAGAFAGANLWTAIGTNVDAVSLPDTPWVGALMGLLIVGLMAFMYFRFVVVMLTTIGGASLLVFGALSALLHVEAWRGGITESMEGNPLLVPVIVASAVLLGAIFQFGGGLQGMNRMADNADPAKAKQQKAAA